jgi:hypothetical protein
MMTVVNLKPFMRPNLDVLFVALNPPMQSNNNGHYFSGEQSRFFDLLYFSGLITERLPKANADEIVFGSTSVNFKGKEFGVVDLVEHLVETDSGKVKPTRQDTSFLLQRIRQFEPRFVCVIHSKVRDALNAHPDVIAPLDYGVWGPVLKGSPSRFVLNYFPNGNSVPDEPKLAIYKTLRDAL